MYVPICTIIMLKEASYTYLCQPCANNANMFIFRAIHMASTLYKLFTTGKLFTKNRQYWSVLYRLLAFSGQLYKAVELFYVHNCLTTRTEHFNYIGKMYEKIFEENLSFFDYIMIFISKRVLILAKMFTSLKKTNISQNFLMIFSRVGQMHDRISL